MRVLLIEDDSAVAQSIELMLKSESFNVYTTDLGEEGVDLGKLYDYDIILLDLNLPDMSGYDVLKQLRVSKIKTPILILSGLAGIEDKVKGLGVGADDYMTKPFHKDELVARIHAIVRRSKGHAQSVIQTGDLVVNLDTKTVEVGGQRVHLTGKEYQMLELLSLRKGTTLTKEMFLNHLYGGMDEPELKIIDVFICKLRKKLANASEGRNFIETVWGRGYVLREPHEHRRAHSRLITGFTREPARLAPPRLDPAANGGVFVWGLNAATPGALTGRSCTSPNPDESGASMILQSLAGLPAFLVYFCTAIIAVVAYLFVYTRVTPHNEFQLIRDNDPAAAIALGLSLLGFVLPVVSAIAHSANVVDCLIWSAIALIVQIAVYFIVKIPVPNLSARIAAGELAAAIWLGLASLAAGALNAASMIY